MRAALLCFLIVASGACAAGQPIQNDMRGVPVDVGSPAGKSPLSDLESKIADIAGQIAKLKAQAAKLEDVAAAIESLMPDLMAALGSDPNSRPPFATEPGWKTFLADSVAICKQGHCDEETQTQLATLCANAGCTPATEAPSPKFRAHNRAVSAGRARIRRLGRSSSRRPPTTQAEPRLGRPGGVQA